MAIINKEPYITPEMIAAWNAGTPAVESTTINTYCRLQKSGSVVTINCTSWTQISGFAIPAGYRHSFNDYLYVAGMFADASNNIYTGYIAFDNSGAVVGQYPANAVKFIASGAWII